MDDFFRFPCSACGKRLKAKPEDTGKKAHCNKCGTHFVVPTVLPPALAEGAFPKPALFEPLSKPQPAPQLPRPEPPGALASAITTCPKCGKALILPGHLIGKQVRCPRCSNTFVATADRSGQDEQPLAPRPSPPVAQQFYYRQNGERFGPLTLNQMQERAASAQLRPEDLVWREGTPQWVPAREVSNLFEKAPMPVVPAQGIARGQPVDDEIPVVLPVAEGAPPQSYLLRLERDAREALFNSRLLFGCHTGLVLGLAGSRMGGAVSDQECTENVSGAFRLGWVAAKGKNNVRRQEISSARQIGDDPWDVYTGQHCWSCLEMVMDSQQAENAGDFLSKNNQLCMRILGAVIDALMEDGAFTKTEIKDETYWYLGLAYVCGYVAAKSPEELHNYFTLITSERRPRPLYLKIAEAEGKPIMIERMLGMNATANPNGPVLRAKGKIELIEFECPKCGEPLEIKSRMAGRQIRCVECDQLVRVPG